MKKLMIALAAIALAIGAQAAQWTWGISALSPIYKPNTETAITSGTAYLFAYSTESAATTALATFVDDYAADKLNPTGYANTLGISDGILAASGAMNSDPYSGIAKGDTVYWAMIVVADEGLLVDYTSAIRNADGKNRSVTFYEADNSKSNVFLASGGYQGAGFYTVPEPTSGLMLLLGMAGLALRRRRA